MYPSFFQYNLQHHSYHCFDSFDCIVFLRNGIIKYIHKHESLEYEDEERIYAKIEPNDIGKVKNIYIEKDIGLEKYRVDSVKGYFYAYKKDKKGDPKQDEYFYVMFNEFDKSIYFLQLNEIKSTRKDVSWYKKILNKLGCKEDEWEKEFLDNIKDSIDFNCDHDCKMGNGCEEFQKRQDIIIKNYIKNSKWKEWKEWKDKFDKITNNSIVINVGISANDSTDGIIDEISKKITEIQGMVLVNIIETGLLNYIVYSHRGSEKKRKM